MSLTWEIAGVLGELVGAAAVVVTLIYLAKQVRHSLDYARADAIQSSNAQYIQVFSQLTQDSDMAAVYSKALKDEALDDVETIKFFAFLNIYFAWAESLYNQALADLGFSDYSDGTMDLFTNIRPYASRLLTSEAGKLWWATEAESNFSPEFYDGLRANVVSRYDRESAA